MIAAGHFHRTHDNLAALAVGGLLGLRHRRHTEVITPVRLLAGSKAGHRAEAGATMVEEAIFAMFAHIHEVIALPAELFAIEGASGLRIAGRQLIPAATARLSR